MKSFLNISGLLLASLLIMSGCTQKEIPEPDDPTPGPHQTLIKIIQMSQSNDFSKLPMYVLGYQYAPGKNSADQIVDGIKQSKKTGDFSYSKEAFQYIVHNAKFKIVPIGDNALSEIFLDKSAPFFLDSYFQDLAKNHREKIYNYQEGICQLVLVDVEGIYKIIYSKNITSLLNRAK